MMKTGLTFVGYGWSLLSLIASGLVCAGYYIPMWLIGTLYLNEQAMPAYFGTFRRCNYPIKVEATTRLGLLERCGRYATFEDIPTMWWQISTVTIGFGSALGLLVAFITIPACVLKDVVSRTSARVLGIAQIFSAILIIAGGIMYPLGWDTREVADACGSQSGQYLLGRCTIGWSYYMVLGGACLLMICGSLSTKAGHPIEWEKVKTHPGYDEQSNLRTADV